MPKLKINFRFKKSARSRIFSRKLTLACLVVAFLFFYLLMSSWVRILLSELGYVPSEHMISPLEMDIRRLVGDAPIARMAPYIAKYDRKTAAFIISVAKKESDWGNSVPKLDGRDCFNYWGYRGSEGKLTWDGYSCFDTREQAVQTVAARFKDLMYNSGLDTPAKMIVWKCGWDCSEHSPDSVDKWISDVDYYFKEFQ